MVRLRLKSLSIIQEAVHTDYMRYCAVTTVDVWKKNREDLNIRRNSLFKQYSKTPHDLDLALQIKKIDDEIAECTDKMTQQRLSERKSK